MLKRLAALEAEVKADADAQRARKEAALAKVREQRATQQAERDALRTRQAALVSRKKPADSPSSSTNGVGDALALARRAHDVKEELARKPQRGEKSWIKSGIASMVVGPLGWLYAGSLREAVPAGAAWLAAMAVLGKLLPVFLLMPVLMVALPLSGIAGVVYALQYNRTGSRQRLFGDDKKNKTKQLREPDEPEDL
ncbi:MAG: hypothetical protein ACTHU0_09060 [Kofleriaceae bacterium]